jgi:hypothetical protein
MQGFELTIEIDKEEPEAAEILVDGQADGAEFRFLLDTGSSKTILRYNEASAHYGSLGKHGLMGLFGKIECDLIQVKHFALGALKKTDFEIARMSKDGPPRSQIGMDLLQDYCLHFIFEKNRVEVVSAADQFSDAIHIPLMLGRKEIPFVDLTLAGRLANCFWDSGAGITAVDFKFIEGNPHAFSSLGSLGIEDTTESGAVDMPMFLMKGLSAGDVSFPSHRVVGVDLSQVNSKMEKPMDIILGYNTLAKANWLFDFPNRKCLLTKMLG